MLYLEVDDRQAPVHPQVNRYEDEVVCEQIVPSGPAFETCKAYIKIGKKCVLTFYLTF
jgi:hypothetical protein